MPAFVYELLVGLVPALTGWVFQLLLALGIGFATFTGVDIAFGQLHDFVVGQYGALGESVSGVMGLLRVDQAFNLILSACTARMTLQGLTGGGIRRLVFRTPA